MISSATSKQLVRILVEELGIDKAFAVVHRISAEVTGNSSFAMSMRVLDKLLFTEFDLHKAQRSSVEAKLSDNQHAKWEQWKSICPQCASIHTKHFSGSREYDVRLRCTDCKRVFTLKERFNAQLARESAA